MSLPSSWEKSVRDLAKSNLGSDPGGHLQGKNLWFADEKYANVKISNYSDSSKFLLLDREGGQNGHRIDRDNWRYDESLILRKFYFDSHLIRPYHHHKEEINRVADLVMNSKNEIGELL